MENILKRSLVQLSYTDNQKTNSPAVVFIHGFPFDRTMWDAEAAFLDAHFRVVTYDHRGFGKNPPIHSPYLFEHLVDDLFALLDHLNIQEAVLCGLSMGGYVALRAAERESKRIKGLILCDTRSEADPDATKLKRAADLLLIQEQGLEAFVDKFLKSLLCAKTFQDKPAIVQRVRAMMLRNPTASVQAALVALAARTDTSAALSKISSPALVVVGGEDVITPVSNAQTLHKHISGSTLAILPHAGHLSNLENPSAFEHELLNFLAPIRER